jgi:hypothetical protein
MSLENPGSGNKYEQQKELNEAEKEAAIRGTYTFDQLYSAPDKVGSIQGSQGTFEAEQLQDKINRVRSGAIDLNYITRTHGLRDTVERLLQSPNPVESQIPPQPSAIETPSLEVTQESPIEEPASEATPEHTHSGAPAAESHEPRIQESEDAQGEMPNQPEIVANDESDNVIDLTSEQIEEARQEMEVDSIERRKVEIITRAFTDASEERVSTNIGALRQQVGGSRNAERVDVWEGIRRSISGNAYLEMSSNIATIRQETEQNSFLSKIAESIHSDVFEGPSKSMKIPESIDRDPSGMLAGYIAERGAELSGNELGEVEDALYLLSLNAQYKFFQWQRSDQLQSVLDLQEQLLKVNDEFDPARSGFFELRNTLENARASIELDWNSKPNYKYAHPEYSLRFNNISTLLHKLHQIGVVKFFKEHDLELEDE